MADPISSLSSYPPNSCVDGEGEASPPVAPSPSTVTPAPAPAPANECSPDAAPAEPPSATQSLVRKFPAASAASVVAPSASTGSSTPTTASLRHLVTSSGPVYGGSSQRVARSLVLGEIKSGVFQGTGEIGTVSAQHGTDNDFQIVGQRGTGVVSKSGYSLSITADAAVARANLGEHNDDGSIGGNLGLAAELVGVEGTLNTPIGSVTYGNSMSTGASGSMGVRDADHDGKPEFCAKFSIPEYTVGACVEQFW